MSRFRCIAPSMSGHQPKQPHSLVMLLIPWKLLIFGPPFLFQISNDVQSRGCGSSVTPKFGHLLNACKVMLCSKNKAPLA